MKEFEHAIVIDGVLGWFLFPTLVTDQWHHCLVEMKNIG